MSTRMEICPWCWGTFHADVHNQDVCKEKYREVLEVERQMWHGKITREQFVERRAEAVKRVNKGTK